MMKYLLSLMVIAMTALPVLASAAGGDAQAPVASNPFAGTIYQSVAAAVVFLTLLWLLKSKAWGPILTGLQDRESKIKGDLENAETAAREAAATLEQHKQQLANAQADARKLIDQARADAEAMAAELKSKSQAEITQIKDRAAAEIQSAKEQAVADIYNQTAELATAVAGRILQREISAADQQQLINESLDQLRQSQN